MAERTTCDVSCASQPRYLRYVSLRKVVGLVAIVVVLLPDGVLLGALAIVAMRIGGVAAVVRKGGARQPFGWGWDESRVRRPRAVQMDLGCTRTH